MALGLAPRRNSKPFTDEDCSLVARGGTPDVLLLRASKDRKGKYELAPDRRPRDRVFWESRSRADIALAIELSGHASVEAGVGRARGYCCVSAKTGDSKLPDNSVPSFRVIYVEDLASRPTLD
ncbi:MAG: hypothetical protein JO168_03405 [Solirubrobacterales bacterium]|nr:hypothetical protein [Solirubrobacterales bacterium]